MKKWLALVKILAPIVLTAVKPELAPITENITDAITEAEQIKGASGPDKLKHVKNIALNAAKTVNSVKNKEIIDTNSLDNAVEQATNTVVAVANIINKQNPK